MQIQDSSQLIQLDKKRKAPQFWADRENQRRFLDGAGRRLGVKIPGRLVPGMPSSFRVLFMRLLIVCALLYFVTFALCLNGSH